MPTYNRATHNRGFTFLELIIAVAILAITTAIAAPNVVDMIKNARIEGAVGDFTTAMQLAKSEAASRVNPVTLCKSSNGTGCAGGDTWAQGWIAFEDLNGNASVDDDDQVLLAHETLHPTVTFSATGGVDTFITYRPSGTSSVRNAETMVICDDRGMTNRSRAIIVTITGRGSVMKAQDSGGAC